MTSWAQIVAELVAAGLAGEALVAACRRIEAAGRAQNATVAPVALAHATVGEAAAAATVHETIHAPVRPLAVMRAGLNADAALSRAAARVGAVILDHFDGKSGICCISGPALAQKTGLHLATVWRAVKALVAGGHFIRMSYEGIGHANAYRPLLDGNSRANATVDRRNSRSAATQSQREIYNPSDSGLGSMAATVAPKPPRKRRQRAPDPKQPQMLMPIPGDAQRRVVPPVLMCRVPFKDIAARKATERLFEAWDKATKGHGEQAARQLERAPDPNFFAAWDVGVAAERHAAGTGWAAFDAESDRLMAVAAAARRATGPP